MTVHIKLTSADFVKTEELIPDAFIAEDDLAAIKCLAGIGNSARLTEYTDHKTEGSNCSITAMEKVNYQHEHNVKPGTPEWFRLWFSKPYLTGESPF